MDCYHSHRLEEKLVLYIIQISECQRIYYGGDPESPVHEARENVDVKIWNFTLEIEYDTNQVDVREDEETGMANILANGIAIHFKGDNNQILQG